MLLSDKVKISTALDYTSGTADRTGTVIDMGGYEGVLMIVKFAAIATGGTNSIKAQTATTAAFSTPHDVTGTAQAIADDDDNQVFVIDLNRPAERYVRLYVDKDTANACAESAIYIRYGGGYVPETNAAADAVSIETFYQPVTGTA